MKIDKKKIVKDDFKIMLIFQSKKYPLHTFALKCMKKHHIVETHQQDHVYSERDIMMACRNMFITRLYKTFKVDIVMIIIDFR